MDEIRIDRLSLQLTGLSEAEGRRLAQLIVEGLTAADVPPSAVGGSRALRVDVAGRSPSLETLSEQVVADVLRELRRSA